jgi:Methyltransferase domain
VTGSETVRALAGESRTRLDLWAAFLDRLDAHKVAEIGVYRGAFAARMLASCPAIETYYMIDPWRHLDDWNKPANRDDPSFERIFEEAMDVTSEHAARRVVLRGRTTEVIERIPDGSLDFAYLDGDHTLRGITTDLVRVYPKIRVGGWIGGDDFRRSIWQHGAQFEPTLVFPFAVYFAEAVGCPIHALSHRQFLIENQPERGFHFVDVDGRYPRLDLLSQLASRRAAAERGERRSALRTLRDRLRRGSR